MMRGSILSKNWILGYGSDNVSLRHEQSCPFSCTEYCSGTVFCCSCPGNSLVFPQPERYLIGGPAQIFHDCVLRTEFSVCSLVRSWTEWRHLFPNTEWNVVLVDFPMIQTCPQKKKKIKIYNGFCKNLHSKKSDLRRIRTCNLLIRSQAPYHWASRPCWYRLRGIYGTKKGCGFMRVVLWETKRMKRNLWFT